MITKTEERLILELQKNGRASYAELAAKLGITPATVAKQVERLIASKVIDIRAVQNPFKLGLMANALIGIKADPAKIEDVCNQLVNNFHVNNVMTVFGQFDILIIVFSPPGKCYLILFKKSFPGLTEFYNSKPIKSVRSKNDLTSLWRTPRSMESRRS